MALSPRRTDHELVAAVQAAVQKGVSPEEIEVIVGQQAWLNTIRSPGRLTVQGVNLGIDEDSGEPMLPIHEARDVVYWGRPLSGRNPRVIGVRWDKEGHPAVFFGVLYPP